MDTIDHAFTTASMDDDNFSLPIKVALELGKRIMNKYYNLTDESEIYHVSIGTLFLFIALLCLTHFIVLHPGLKTQYFKDNKWPQNWQDNVIAITRKSFDEEYKEPGKPDGLPNSSVDPRPSNTVSTPSVAISLLIC